MTAHTTTLDLVSAELQEQDSRAARRRFGAIVGALARLRPARPAMQQAVDLDEVQPTRRVNRIRKLLGKLPWHGKSRAHARRLR